MVSTFFGALAASASVFIAILTALLVNEYTRIHGERNRIRNRLDRIEGETARYEMEREDYANDKQRIDDDWEAEWREEAEERVDEFIDEYIGSGFCEPIETFQIQDLLERLAEFHDIDGVEELREEYERERPHHRNLLEERRDEIEDTIVPRVTRDFAEEHEGAGWDRSDSLLLERLAEDDDFDEEDFREDMPEPMSEEEFLQGFREEYGIENLREKTREQLEAYYEEIVATPPSSGDLVTGGSTSQSALGIDSSRFGIGPSTAARLAEIAETPTLGAQMDFGEIPTEAEVKESWRKRDRYVKLRDELTRIDSSLRGLQREENELLDRREGLTQQLQELRSAMGANVLAVIFSVIIPMFLYLLTVTNIEIRVPDPLIGAEMVIGFFAWLAGFWISFDWLNTHINDGHARGERLYSAVGTLIGVIAKSGEGNS